jgi:tRNA pseudouridine38-40 synthase
MPPMRRNLKMNIAYDGGRYLGWQDNGDGPSIEGELRRCLERVLQHKVTLQAASRTDRGVHAEGQVVNCFTDHPLPCWRMVRGLNGLLPPDIRVQAIEEAPEDFHPTLDATGKVYHYRVATGAVQLPHHRHLSWHVPEPLDQTAMERAAEQLIGTHDFTTLSNRRKGESSDRIRTVDSIEFEEWEGGILIAVRGENFLYKMVRNIVGLLVDIGRGKLDAEPASILVQRNRPLAGVTAPSHGLTLYQVFHCPKSILNA